QDEIGQLKTELTRIASTTEFNGTKLLDGNYNGTFQVGARNTADDRISVSIAAGTGLGATGLGLANLDVTNSNATTMGSSVTGHTLSMVGGTAPTVSLAGNALDLTGWDTSGTVEAA